MPVGEGHRGGPVISGGAADLSPGLSRAHIPFLRDEWPLREELRPKLFPLLLSREAPRVSYPPVLAGPGAGPAPVGRVASSSPAPRPSCWGGHVGVWAGAHMHAQTTHRGPGGREPGLWSQPTSEPRPRDAAGPTGPAGGSASAGRAGRAESSQSPGGGRSCAEKGPS